MSKIFVQIASYRDPELVPTIEDCIAKASDPSALTFGVVRQLDLDDDFNSMYDRIVGMPNVRTIDFDARESRGLGWARAHVQTLYEGEALTMQLDSHHRFRQGWDATLKNSLAKTGGSKKPMLTGYLPGYELGKPLDLSDSARDSVILIVPQGFRRSHGTIPLVGHYIGPRSSPVPARFVSGHFFFTLGSHAVEFKYDPDVYFFGDELTLSVRSYTLGYDLFHPEKNVVFHNYATYARKRNSDDVRDWAELDRASVRRIQQLVGERDHGIDLGPYGLGRERTLADYERYAGIDFGRMKIHPDALASRLPPTEYADDSDWTKNLRTLQINLKAYARLLRDFEYDTLYAGFDSAHGKTMYSKTFPRVLLDQTQHDDWWLSFYSDEPPVKLVIYGMRGDRDMTWSERIEIPFVIMDERDS